MIIQEVHSEVFPRSRLAGFTAIELMVVILTIAILGAALLPSLAKTQSSSRGTQCLNNHRQLALAWNLYSVDNQSRICRTAGLDSLVASVSPTKNYPQNQWCMGTMDTAPSWTNRALILDSLLFRFVGNIEAYHCPSDISSVQSNKLSLAGGGGIIRSRSVSMNAWMNPINAWAADNPSGANPVRNFRYLANVDKPNFTFVTIDENPATINDGWIVSDPRNTTSWIDLPATSHEGGSALSFADGHSEIKVWHDRALLGAGVGVGIATKDKGVDLKWLHARSTY